MATEGWANVITSLALVGSATRRGRVSIHNRVEDREFVPKGPLEPSLTPPLTPRWCVASCVGR